MSLISFAAALAVSCQFVSWYGLFAQIQFTNSRRSVRGLSLVEAEARLWGKLPWLLFACSLPAVDWTVLATNSVSISLAGWALWQFAHFESSAASRALHRVFFQFALLLSTGVACILFRASLLESSAVWCVLPVAVTIIALSSGSVSQFRENLRQRSTAALSLTRYVTLMASYLLWFIYGYLKGTTVGWEGAWTICASTGLGLVASSAILIQFYIYREQRYRTSQSYLPLASQKPA